MRCLGLVLITPGLVAGAVRADDRATARALIDKAILAQGGEAELSKWTAAAARHEGIFHGQGNKLVFFFTAEITRQGADRVRYVVNGKAGDRTFRHCYVLNGNRGWLSRDERTWACRREELDKLQEAAYADWVATLLPLKSPAFTLVPAGAVNVADRPALGVRVSSPGHRDVSLFFDQETGFLIKTQTRSKDDRGEEASEETFLSDYRAVKGTKQAMKVAIHRDGKPYLTYWVTDYEPREKMRDGTFDKPGAAERGTARNRGGR